MNNYNIPKIMTSIKIPKLTFSETTQKNEKVITYSLDQLNKESFLHGIGSIPFLEWAKKLSLSNYRYATKNVIIDGNIASGKTTFIDNMYEHLHKHIYRSDAQKSNSKDNVKIIFYCIKENIEHNKDLFDKYMVNRKEYAYKFQHWIISEKYMQFKKILSKIKKSDNSEHKSLHIILWDRSFNVDSLIFARMLHEKEFINQKDWLSYNQFIIKIKNIHSMIKYPSLVIYLNTCVKKCSERIKLRNRENETYSLSFLKELENRHSYLYDFYDDPYKRLIYPIKYPRDQIVVIDGDVEKENMIESLKKYFSRFI